MESEWVIVDDITSRLFDECKLFDLDKSTSKEPKGSVLKTDGVKKNNARKSDRKEYKCWSCGDKDSKHECKKAFCSLCGKQGHLAFKCPDKEKQEKNNDSQVSMMASIEPDKSVFLLDSGSSHHITIDRSILFDYSNLEEPIQLGTSKQGSYITLVGKGKMKFHVNNRNIEIKDVFYSTNANANLLSNSVLDAKGARTLIEKGKVSLKTADGTEFLTGTLNGSLYKLNINPFKNPNAVYLSVEKVNVIDIAQEGGYCAMTAKELHLNLGHTNIKRVEKIAKIMDVKLDQSEPCIDCAKAKITRDSFKYKSTRATTPLELVGHNCFSLFIDDYSNYCIGYIMSSKGQVKDCFFKYAKITQAKYGTKIATLRIDDGQEYKSSDFLSFCQDNGTVIQTSDGYTPELNGKSERFMRSIFEMMRANLLSSRLPKELWDEAFFYSIYTLNVLPTEALQGNSSSLLWTQKEPNYTTLQRLGLLLLNTFQKKLERNSMIKENYVCLLGMIKQATDC